MKLLSHNMLTSKCIKGVNVGYPLAIQATDVKILDVDFNKEFISRLIPRIEWEALLGAVVNLGQTTEIPKVVPEDYAENEIFLKQAHHALLEVEVVEGELICPETGRKFPIKNGIPNMLLREDEV
ncbi:multifunctional methyltransferase subunit TRM112-like protein [Ctenocephalides felis]|uniref:multifunctional methyltransferase subunit TRM112-like protein n=1 Tax=Ctenocephalides felis TaxID=7515 RepID=UPI000E6E2C34|nr:multifunctional methyltransferase subunit TRM112-like protein [Ctenocephalides felis]